MIEEQARVVALDGEFAWVETERRGSCGSCGSEKGCSTSAMSKLLDHKPLRVRVLNPLGATVGEGVVIGLSEAALVRSSLVVYLFPLFSMLLGALLVGSTGSGDGMVAIAGIAGLGVGFLGVRAFSKNVSGKPLYQPAILRESKGLMEAVPLRFIK